MANKQTRTRTPKPIPAMLEGGFATKLENLIAAKNNELARQGLLTDAPEFVFLSEIRRELTREGIATFDRVTGQVQGPEEEPAPAPARKARKKTTSRKRKSVRPATEPTPEPAATESQARVCTEDEVLSIVADRTLTDEAPYGRDSEGLALAPYGVKKDGTPKRRRGRGEPDFMAELRGEVTDSDSDSEEVEEPTEVEEVETASDSDFEDDSEDDEVDASDLSLDLSGVVDGGDEDEDEDDEISSEDLDELLNDL